MAAGPRDAECLLRSNRTPHRRMDSGPVQNPTIHRGHGRTRAGNDTSFLGPLATENGGHHIYVD